jgi:hypothetical protein
LDPGNRVRRKQPTTAVWEKFWIFTIQLIKSKDSRQPRNLTEIFEVIESVFLPHPAHAAQSFASPTGWMDGKALRTAWPVHRFGLTEATASLFHGAAKLTDNQ